MSLLLLHLLLSCWSPTQGQQSAYSAVPDYGSPSGPVISQPEYGPPSGPVITQPPFTNFLNSDNPESSQFIPDPPASPTRPTSPTAPSPTASTPETTASETEDMITGGVDFSKAVVTEDGRLCVIKDSEVQTLSKDPILECKHRDVEKCHYTYITTFKAAQEEQCEENFEKICNIIFKQEAAKETVRKCYRPLEKVCNGQGPEECRTLYESSCTTRYIKEGPGQFVGDTRCQKKPVEICGAGCLSQEGEEECHEKMVDTLVDVPEETCDLNPQKSCRLVTRLVPSLRPKLECTVVPQDNCNLKFSSPKQVRKPLRTEWCLDQGQKTQDPRTPRRLDFVRGNQGKRSLVTYVSHLPKHVSRVPVNKKLMANNGQETEKNM